MKIKLSHRDLVTAMQDAGLGQVDRLLMHSSLHSLGRVDGGAETLIDALLEVLGEEGTLMAPTFNYNLEEEVFDPTTVRSQTGLITEILRKRPEAIRSLHPNYSVAAIGRDAEELTREHWKAEATGVGLSHRSHRSGGVDPSCCWGSSMIPTPACTLARPMPRCPIEASPSIPVGLEPPRSERPPKRS